ncbi:VWA domain-containing protein [Shewanella intestini]|uniref:VWA domain-containing protein n=1 Tax=Shewanella intestini TaxID=2017544 RepID=A0ABS5I0B3_9GAMM|nr:MULTISPECIES: VWA domain-containing protein [Shewanella]MBR9727464.1 VWA domain-containing protein [Shewanella intestini]MRG35486.1 VWA domain-containing protein [Shewanella sp. XMDDZSB0408]
MIHFIRPEWLWALVPAIIFFSLIAKHHKSQSAWDNYIAPHLSKILIGQQQSVTKQPKWVILLCWIIAVLALSGPALQKQPLPVFAKDQGRVIIVDMSLSMYASDLTPNRLSHLRFKATDLVNALKEGDTGLIAYAGDAFVISPLTQDKGTILNLLPTLSPDIMPVRGSNLASALEQAQKLLKQGGHQTGDIIVLSDGLSDEQFNQAAKTLADPFRLSVMAIGTEQGSPIKLPNGQFLRDNKNDVVVAKTNMSLFDKLTKQHHGIVVPIQADGSDINTITTWLDTSGKSSKTAFTSETWHDLGPYIALFLLLPLLLNFRYKLLQCVAPIPLVILLAMSVLPSPAAQANTWDDLWRTGDQQGKQAFEKQQFKDAASKFTSPQWQASAQYKAGNYKQALPLYEQDKSANGLYNQANTLMQLGKYQQAADRYNQALKQQTDFPQAQQNLALAKSLLAQQKKQQQNKNQSDKKDQGNKSNKGDKSKKDPQSQQGQQQSKDGKGQQQSGDKKQSQDNQGKSGQQPQNQQKQQQNNSANNHSDKQQHQGDKQDSQKNQSQSQAPNDKKPANAEPQSTPKQQQSAATQGEHSPKKPDNEAQMQANSAQQAANKQKATAKDKAQAPAANPKPVNGQQAKDNQPPAAASSVSPAEKETQAMPIEMERALRAVSEDPQVLIRNKMQLEYQKRRQNGQLPKDKQQW